MTCGVYAIRNKLNNKIYVGQTIDLERRKKRHFNDLIGQRHYNDHLQNSFNKYGRDAFEFIILELCKECELNDVEVWWIDYFDSTNEDNGYNLRTGGDSLFKLNDETKQKISLKTKGENHPFYGKHHSEETKQKMSKSRPSITGENHHYYGKKRSLESKIQNSKTQKGGKGIFRVNKYFRADYPNNTLYQYTWRVNGKRKTVSAPTLDKLKDKVLAKGLEWIEFDEVCDEVKIND